MVWMDLSFVICFNFGHMDIFQTMLSLLSGSSDAARAAELRRTAFASGRGRLHH